MGAVTVAARRPALVTALASVGFAAALAAASQVAIPVPGTPVPLTLQPLVVVLAGLWLGPGAGAASTLFFLAAGAAGLPVFAPGGAPGVLRLIGPTGGYLLAYPLAALVAGWVSGRAPSLAGRVAAAVAGVLTLLAGGVAQLALLGGDLGHAIAAGFLPFVGLDLAKAVIAAFLSPRRGSETAAA